VLERIDFGIGTDADRLSCLTVADWKYRRRSGIQDIDRDTDADTDSLGDMNDNVANGTFSPVID
jgi:hypothetical protein